MKAACEGRLVPTEAELARAEGRDYEPADVLVQRLLGERRRTGIKVRMREDNRRANPALGGGLETTTGSRSPPKPPD